MTLAMPRPDNLRVPDGQRLLVDSDVYNICERIKEVDPNLYVNAFKTPVQYGEHTFPYCVTEMCEDGVERLVKHYEELDARIIEDVQRMRKIPFEQRFAAAEKEEADREAQRKEAQLGELYETMGRPMWSQLEHDGFIQRPRSFPKRGVKR